MINYVDNLNATVDAATNDARVEYYRVCTLKSYVMILVGTCIFMDKSTTYVDIVYNKYFIDLERIHEFN